MAIGLQLLQHHLHVLEHGGGSGIHQVDQQPGALDVAQEIVAEPRPLSGTGDQAGDIGEDGAIAAGPSHHPEVGHQGGEGIVGDLGAGGREHRDQGALAGIGQADDAHLSQQLQLQLQQPLLPLLALGALLRGAVAVAEVVGVAEAAAAAEGHQQLLATVGEIAEQDAGAGIAHLGAAGHADAEGIATGAGAAVGAAATAVDGLKQTLVLEVQQGLEVGVGLQQHVAAAAAVAAGGATGRNVFLAAERHDAVAATAGLDGDAGLIDELHCIKPKIATCARPDGTTFG